MQINISGTIINGKSKKLIDKINKILLINNTGSIISIETEERCNDRIIYEISIKFKDSSNSIKDFVTSTFIIYPDKKYNKPWKKQINSSLRYTILSYLCQLSFYKNDFIND